LAERQCADRQYNPEQLVQVRNVGWSVGGKRILSDISFDIPTSGFVGLIGPNGAGKSSLMRCMYRVNKPSQGSVHIAGDDIWQLSARAAAQKTAVIVQDLGEHFEMSVREFVEQGLTPHKRMFEPNTTQDNQNLAEVLARFDLTALALQNFSSLSGGEKQRALLARALMQAPKLLIMDEPTNHLDVHYQIDALQQVKSLGLTVFASFHDLNLAAAFCDQIIVLDQGRIVANGSPNDVLTESLISEVFRTCCVVDQHPLYAHPRISYAYNA